MLRLEVKIYGDVQGVGFRAFAYYRAQELGLRGVARNTDDCVEIIAEGKEEALKDFLIALKDGPTYAKVERAEEKWAVATGEFESFDIY